MCKTTCEGDFSTAEIAVTAGTASVDNNAAAGTTVWSDVSADAQVPFENHPWDLDYSEDSVFYQ